MPKNADRIAAYCRKSKFTGRGESVGNQVELCRMYVDAHYGARYTGSMLVYEDEGFSGGNLDRPDFRRMMRAAAERKFKAVVVYRLDRISRSVSDFSGLIQELERLDIAFVSLREQFDTATPMGRAMMYIASVFSQLERETIAERIRDNMHELAKTGRWLGGITPTGYAAESIKSVAMDGRVKKACRLKLIPQQAATVQTIYQLYEKTASLAQTEAELMRRHIQTKTGGCFTRFAIRAILQNPVYLTADADAYRYFLENGADLFASEKDFDAKHGVLAYNRTKQEKGKTTVYNPLGEWIISVGQHPGIISAQEWIRVQGLLQQNRKRACRRLCAHME